MALRAGDCGRTGDRRSRETDPVLNVGRKWGMGTSVCKFGRCRMHDAEMPSFLDLVPGDRGGGGSTQCLVHCGRRSALRARVLRGEGGDLAKPGPAGGLGRGVFACLLSAGGVQSVAGERDDGPASGHDEGMGLGDGVSDGDSRCGDNSPAFSEAWLPGFGLREDLPQPLSRQRVVGRAA